MLATRINTLASLANSVKSGANRPLAYSRMPFVEPPGVTMGRRIKAAMAWKNMKNPQLAAAVGVHPVTVSLWRSDKQAPVDDALGRLAALFSTSKSWFRYGTGPAPWEYADGAPTEPVDPKKRPKPAVYAALHSYLEQCERRGFGPEKLEEVEGMLLDFMYSELFPLPGRERSDDVLLQYMAIAWDAINRGLAVTEPASGIVTVEKTVQQLSKPRRIPKDSIKKNPGRSA